MEQTEKENKHMYQNILDQLFADAYTNFKVNIPYNNYIVYDKKTKNQVKQVIELALSGYKKQDITLSCKNNKTIEIIVASNKPVKETEDKINHYMSQGIKTTGFTLPLDITAAVDKSNIKSKFEDGILTIEFYRKEEANEVTTINIE